MPNKEIVKILFIGDIVGRPGRRAVKHFVSQIKAEEEIDLVLANGENLYAGRGITKEKYEEVIQSGVDYLTSGNHVWREESFFSELSKPETKVLRPANYGSTLPGRGFVKIKVKGVSSEILLINLQGRVFMKDEVDDPFNKAKNIIGSNPDTIPVVDFHAEATSEKIALGFYLDGLACAVVGTHTHVQTADERILPLGTAFISDVGMTGPYYSVLGVKKEIIIEKFLTQIPKSHKVASGDSIFNAVILEINTKTKKTERIKRMSNILKS